MSALLVLLISACASAPVQRLALPEPRLVPAAMGIDVALSQRLCFTTDQSGQPCEPIEARLEIDATSLRLAGFALGRRVGLTRLTARYPRLFPADATARVAADFRRRGLLAIAVSRFLPGVRALVPPVAGAIGMGALRAALAMSVASGVWYGIVCVLAYRAGENADALLDRVASQQRLLGVIAAVLVAGGVAVQLWRRRRAR